MRITVPPTGSRRAKIALVGEQPGKQEVVQGRPFCGPAGRELDDCLQQAGLARCDLYFTNVIKCLDHPITFYVDKPERKAPYWLPAGLEYKEFLRQELQDLHPNVAVALGNAAFFALTERWGVTKWRGSVVESTLVPGLKVLAAIHPDTIIPPKNVFTNKLLLIHDLARAAREAEHPDLPLPNYHIAIQPSFDEAMCYLADITSGATVDVDVELDMVTHNITCLGLAINSVRTLVIPFVDHQGHYWTPDQEAQVWRGVARVLEDSTIVKRGQNILTEMQALWREMGIQLKGPLHDTMIAQKILMPDYPAGLDFICSLHTPLPYYKDEGKAWIKGAISKNFGGWARFYTYNGLDTLATAIAHPAQMADLEHQGNLGTYQRKVDILQPLLYMGLRGTRVDVEAVGRKRQETEQRIEELERELYDVAGKEVKWNSPKAMGEYLYDEQGHHEYKKRNSKGKMARTTNDDALQRLKRQGVKEAEIIEQLRYLKNKVLGTYLAPDVFSSDGRLRCGWNPTGTATGRLSSSANLWDEGTNMQNWPHELLQLLLPDEGYIYISPDLSQAENRIVAYVGRIHEMIEAFESGKDVHCLTGALISGKTYEEVKEEDARGIPAPIGTGKNTWRRWAKPCNHGLNYGMGKGRFSLLLGIGEALGAWLISQYHRAYPGVQTNYQAMVRAMLATDRTVTNLMGRRRWFLGKWGDDLWKEAYAQIPQSTVADKIDEHGLNHVYYNADPRIQHGVHIELLNQIHDSVGFQIPLALGWPHIAYILTDIKCSLEQPLTWHDRSFVIPADFTISLTLMKEGGFDIKGSKWPATQEALARRLEEGYNALLATKGKESKQ